MWFGEFQLSDLIGGSPEFEIQQTDVRDGMPREITLQPETCATLHSAVFYHLFPLLTNRKKNLAFYSCFLFGESLLYFPQGPWSHCVALAKV